VQAFWMHESLYMCNQYRKSVAKSHTVLHMQGICFERTCALSIPVAGGVGVVMYR
jgi:hypothetical protein